MPAQVNGQYYQLALIDLSSSATAGTPFTHRKFSALKFSDEGSKEAVLDASGEIIGFVIKPRKTDGSVTMKLVEADEWRDWLYQEANALSQQLQRPVGIGQVVFTMNVKIGATPGTSRIRRIRAMVQSEAFDASDSQDPLNADVPLFVMDITDDQGRRFVERG